MRSVSTSTLTLKSKPWVYFAPVGEGGLAAYAVQQAAALSRMGIPIIFLGREHMQAQLNLLAPNIEFMTIEEGVRNGSRLRMAIDLIGNLRREVRVLDKLVRERKATCVLFASYAEYFSPFWVRPLKKLRELGVHFGTIVHDPVRDFRIGPRPWHKYCVSTAYSFVDVAFIHDVQELDIGWPNRQVETQVIPHGLYSVPVPDNVDSPSRLRETLSIPEDAIVVLSFGHIRDGKNLDLLIRTLASLPNVHLLVVGREQSTSQKPVQWYKDLADEFGVAPRCHWVNEFVADDEVHRYFRASDIAAMMYSSDFRSASGVLNVAAQFELPILCSSGGGPLRQLVEKYRLGQWVKPDQQEAVQEGLGQLIQSLPLDHNWDQYRSNHCWERNAEIVIEALFENSVGAATSPPGIN